MNGIYLFETECIIYEDEWGERLVSSDIDVCYGTPTRIFLWKVYDYNVCVGKAIVLKVNGLRDPYDTNVVLIPSLKYILSYIHIEDKYNDLVDTLISEIQKTIKEPIGIHACNNKTKCFWWIRGANIISESETLFEGSCFMVVNADIEHSLKFTIEMKLDKIEQEAILDLNMFERFIKDDSIWLGEDYSSDSTPDSMGNSTFE